METYDNLETSKGKDTEEVKMVDKIVVRYVRKLCSCFEIFFLIWFFLFPPFFYIFKCK